MAVLDTPIANECLVALQAGTRGDEGLRRKIHNAAEAYDDSYLLEVSDGDSAVSEEGRRSCARSRAAYSLYYALSDERESPAEALYEALAACEFDEARVDALSDILEGKEGRADALLPAPGPLVRDSDRPAVQQLPLFEAED